MCVCISVDCLDIHYTTGGTIGVVKYADVDCISRWYQCLLFVSVCVCISVLVSCISVFVLVDCTSFCISVSVSCVCVFVLVSQCLVLVSLY
jgi:hypothetical protein